MTAPLSEIVERAAAKCRDATERGTWREEIIIQSACEAYADDIRCQRDGLIDTHNSMRNELNELRAERDAINLEAGTLHSELAYARHAEQELKEQAGMLAGALKHVIAMTDNSNESWTHEQLVGRREARQTLAQFREKCP